MAAPSLLERIWSALAESDRSWSGEEIARDFLKLKGRGPAPDALVRGILSRDRRFREDPPGIWTAAAEAAATLEQGSYLLAWVETAGLPSPSQWRVHFLPYDGRGSLTGQAGAAVVAVAADQPGAWESARRAWAGRRIATLQLGPMQRWRQWMERTWALSEWESPPCDLLLWVRLALVGEGVAPGSTLQEAKPPALARRWRLGPVREDAGGLLLGLAAILDHLLEKYGSRTEEELLQESRQALGARAIPWERFSFGPDELEALPEESGIYRFFNASDRLLYVGKSVNLARRVGSYFRPLPPEASRREDLLGLIRRFEVEPLPSELEAMVRESRAIRAERPPWNVQVEVHPPPALPPSWWWPVVFVAPGQDRLRASAFLLWSAETGLLIHLPREEQGVETAALADWLETALAGAPAGLPVPAPAGSALVLDASEARLVLRFYLQERERCHHADSIHFASGAALAEALLMLAGEGCLEPDPTDLRPVADR